MSEQENNENTPELTTEEQLQKALEDVKHWKAMSRKNEASFKEIKPLADQWNEYQKSQKPKEQQLEEELNALKAEIAEREKAQLKATIGETIGLPKEALDYITGESEEELKAKALRLKTIFGIEEKEEDKKPSIAPNPLQGFVSKPVEREETPEEREFREAIENRRKNKN